MDEFKSCGDVHCSIIVSNTGDGDPPDNAAKFFEFVTNEAESSPQFLSNFEICLLGMIIYTLTFWLCFIKA
jgi:sulfite reductase alpha subunit-like flavoprotein